MKKILLVDDEFDILTAWKLMLEMEGFQVFTASNGKIALELAHARQPDVIITDWMMPVMDGEEFCRRLRAEPGMAAIPVLILSAAVNPPRNAGWQAFRRKPLTIDQLLVMVHELLGR